MKKGQGFNPTEIIFSVTDACNLHCPHCFVSRNAKKLSPEKAISFLKTCKDSSIDTIGFSGGEPFLNLDFILKISKYASQNDFMFDRIMTNGVWWMTETELRDTLKKLYDSGYDGKIGLSYDSFHNQNYSKILTFINSVYKIWNNYSMIEIQSVINDNPDDKIQDLENFEQLSEDLDCAVSLNLDNKTGKGTILLENENIFLPIYREIQSFTAEDPRTWKSKKWFKDDYCQGPGQILFVHPNESIAPCCGFANENTALQIGNINQPLEQVLQKAESNKMVNICYTQGLFTQVKACKKNGTKIPGKTMDICAFCDFICKQN